MIYTLNTRTYLVFCFFTAISHKYYTQHSDPSTTWMVIGRIHAKCKYFHLTSKSILYQFINWIFFQEVKNSLWITSFFNIFIWLGIWMLPVILVTVYTKHFVPDIALHDWILIILLNYQLLSDIAITFEKFAAFSHLILRTLEILPDLLFWKGIGFVNNNLILNF